MKLGPVAKLEKRDKTTSKEFDAGVMPTNCSVIVIFPFYAQFGAIQRPDSGGIVYKFYIFINRNRLSYKI